MDRDRDMQMQLQMEQQQQQQQSQPQSHPDLNGTNSLVSRWLSQHGPGLIHEWCMVNAEPLLSNYLEQWMMLNATQLLTQIATKQSTQQIQQLQTQIAQLHQSQLQHQSSASLHWNPPPPIPKYIPHSPTGAVTGYSPPGHGSIGLGLGRRITSPLALTTQRPNPPSPLDEHAPPGANPALDVRSFMRARASLASSSSPNSLVVHRPLGLGIGRSSSPDGLPLLPAFPHMKGPLAEILSDSTPAPGEEAMREANTQGLTNTGTIGSTGNSVGGGSGMFSPPPYPGRELSGSSVSVSSSARRMSSATATGVLVPAPSGPIDILVVEDIRVAQKVAHAALTRAHFRVDIAGSGEVALDKLRALTQQHGPPKVILMDITLPGMSGIEATERIRKLENDAANSNSTSATPFRSWIYGLTGNVEPDDLIRYQHAGMNGCILKGRLLVEAVRKAVEENERQPKLFVNLAERETTNTISTTPTPAPSVAHTASSAASCSSSSSHSTSSPCVPLFDGDRRGLTSGRHVGASNLSPLPLSPNQPMMSLTPPPPTHMAMAHTMTADAITSADTTPIPKQTFPFPNAMHIQAAVRSVSGSSTPDFTTLNVGATPQPSSPLRTRLGVSRSQSNGTFDPSGVGVDPLLPSSASSSPPSVGVGMVGVGGAGLTLIPKRLVGVSSPSTMGGTKRSSTAMLETTYTNNGQNVVTHTSPSATPTVASASSQQGFDVLLVEDVRVAQRIAQRALQSSGYRVDVASSGESAVERFKLHADTIRIVLMDINLPGMSGVEATELLRQHEQHLRQVESSDPSSRPHTPALIFGLTGNTDQANLCLYERAGMNGCIAKGTLIGSAVRTAVEAAHRAPGTFIHLAGSTPTQQTQTATNSIQGGANACAMPISPSSGASLSTTHSPLPIRLYTPPESRAPLSSSAGVGELFTCNCCSGGECVVDSCRCTGDGGPCACLTVTLPSTGGTESERDSQRTFKRPRIDTNTTTTTAAADNNTTHTRDEQNNQDTNANCHSNQQTSDETMDEHNRST